MMLDKVIAGVITLYFIVWMIYLIRFNQEFKMSMKAFDDSLHSNSIYQNNLHLNKMVKALDKTNKAMFWPYYVIKGW